MRLPSLRMATTHELPLWPPVLATRGPGARSEGHAHHAMHLVLCLEGELRIRSSKRTWDSAAGVLTAPDVPHALDAEGREILLVFLDPESAVGATLRGAFEGPVRLLTAAERNRLIVNADPLAIMQAEGVEWTARAVETLSGSASIATRTIHPRVSRLLKILQTMPSDGDTSLEALAEAVDLSPGRLMHAFTESIGTPLRPYLAWLRMQRAAAAIVTGSSLSEAAHAAGFSDSAHMSRTFRRTFGMTPSSLRPSSRS